MRYPPNILRHLLSAISTQRRLLRSVDKLPVSSSFVGESYDCARSAFFYVSYPPKLRILTQLIAILPRLNPASCTIHLRDLILSSSQQYITNSTLRRYME